LKFIKEGIMQTKQTDYYVYMLKNGAVKCGNPLELPQFMRDKIFKIVGG